MGVWADDGLLDGCLGSFVSVGVCWLAFACYVGFGGYDSFCCVVYLVLIGDLLVFRVWVDIFVLFGFKVWVLVRFCVFA